MCNYFLGFSTLITTVGERITMARSARGASQGDLARESGIAATQLSRYETGRATPRKLALARLAQALAVSLEWLERGDGEMDEYPTAEGKGLAFHVDAEIADRIAAYAYFHGVTVPEAIAEILDNALSVYSEKELPFMPEDKEKLVRLIRATHGQRSRRKALAGKVKLLPEPVSGESRLVRSRDLRIDALDYYKQVLSRESEPIPPKQTNRGPVRSPNARKPRP
ncbi:transcriptional regulator with XRE-family HTH domain [Variovorax paradoxus]|uniref:helix-turn-helix domain-containing protein n=1 Tax=Variovorax paradoxus TaxID=34073 RepID=UPI00339ABBAB